MSLVSELEKIIKDREAVRNVKKHIEFYDSMTRLGIVKKEEYNIPLVDTVGIRCIKDNSNYFI